MSNSPLHQGDEPQDCEIISRVLGGDANAFETLVHRYSRLVFGIVGKHIPRNYVDEVAQDAFVEGFRSLRSFSQTGPFGHWMAKIAVRCCYDFWRKRHRKKEVSLSDLSQGAQDWMDDLLAVQSSETFKREAAASEAIEILNHALGLLSAEDRMVVALVHLEGLPVKEAAVLLGWSTTAVKVRAHRSRKKLHRIILELQDDSMQSQKR
ncbi:MAG: RNA polymerase sigma factor [Deltaproteobacteria bacterium]|nr:RNA polymerase sigma factor [Deltaproteobacteria bacterium]